MFACIARAKTRILMATILGKMFQFWIFFFFQKLSCFSCCGFTLELIKKICGGRIFFFERGEELLFLICFRNRKLALPQSALQEPKREFLCPQFSEKCSNFRFFFSFKNGVALVVVGLLWN